MSFFKQKSTHPIDVASARADGALSLFEKAKHELDVATGILEAHVENVGSWIEHIEQEAANKVAHLKAERETAASNAAQNKKVAEKLADFTRS